MSSAVPASFSFSELFPDLFSIISTQLPLCDRAPTLLSLALTCHRLHDVIIPHLLYDSVRLGSEDQALPVLRRFITGANAVSKDDLRIGGKPSTSHRIRHLCIDSLPPEPCLTELHTLVDIKGLYNLVSLTLYARESFTDNPTTPPSPFWSSLRENCPSLTNVHVTGLLYDQEAQWIQHNLSLMQGLRSIRLEGEIWREKTEESDLQDDKFITLDTSRFPSSLHTLELRLTDAHDWVRRSGAEELLSCSFPNLRCLILDWFDIGQSAVSSQFWKLHSGLERLELLANMTGNWFKNFESGMLPNLRILKCDFDSARVLLPHMAESIVNLCLHTTYNAQAPYLLRTIPQSGTLPALRSLGIHRESRSGRKHFEGHRWREEENGTTTEVKQKNAARRFDGNYIMSLAKAAPNLEELELMGDSEGTLDPITASLSRMPKIRRLTLSGPINTSSQPFFKSFYNWTDYAKLPVRAPENHHGKYEPISFEQAAYDLANGCRTLETVTIGEMIGDFVIRNGLSARIVREAEGGPVKEVKRIRAWGNMIGKEEEW